MSSTSGHTSASPIGAYVQKGAVYKVSGEGDAADW